MLKFLRVKKADGTLGFTLIELLVVIAIIGVLASIVLASLNNARLKGRDARRLTDIKQIQLALELYFDGQGSKYPAGSTTCDSTHENGLETLSATGNNYIPQVPRDPGAGNLCYAYATVSSSIQTAYHLGAVLEDIKNSALTTDKDASLGAYTGGVDFYGNSTNCGNIAGTPQPGGTEQCYDVVP